MDLILTDVIRADLEGLIASHDKTDLLCFFMAKEANVTSPALLPFSGFRVESEEFSAPVSFNENRNEIVESMRLIWKDISLIMRSTHILKSTSSSSSIVFVSTCSVSLMTGSK